MTSWLTASEIVVWIAAAAVAGVVLGASVNELRHRARAASKPTAAAEETKPAGTIEVPPKPGSRKSASDRRIKGNEKSKIFHTPDSPAYGRTKADVWFATEDEALAAGYRKPKNA